MSQIKRAYDEVSKDDGFRILVDRLWPRGLSKEKLKLDLNERGIDVPAEYLTEEGMVDWLWTLLSKK